MAHANAQFPVARAPGLIRMPGPLVNRLLEWGVPLGPNVLVTIRGRVSGEPRTQPIAIIGDNGRRWLAGTFGDVNWCRNLRANPELEIRHGRRAEHLYARELAPAEADEFFRTTLPQAIAHMPLYLKLFGRVFIRLTAGEMLTDPGLAARTHPVFELIADPSATYRTA